MRVKVKIGRVSFYGVCAVCAIAHESDGPSHLNQKRCRRQLFLGLRQSATGAGDRATLLAPKVQGGFLPRLICVDEIYPKSLSAGNPSPHSKH